MSDNTPVSPGELSPGEQGPGSVDPTLVDRRTDKRRTQVRWIAAGSAVAVLAVAGVVVANIAGKGDSATANPGDAVTTAAGSDPAAVVTVGLTLEPSNLDIRATSGIALDQVLIDNVYQGLVRRSADGTISPSLATSWKASDDALTYTFTLAEGATFSNGDKLTSADVLWSINDLRTQNRSGAEDLAAVSAVTAPDEKTVVVALTKPDPSLLWALSGRAGLVLDPDATNDRGTTAVGSGPYVLDGWKQGDSITLTRNGHYWGKDTAQVAKVVFRYIKDTNAAVNAFNAGDLDVLAPVSALQSSQVTTSGVKLVTGAAADKFVLAFNNSKAPFTDIRVRQAIRYAIDHEALVKARGGVDALLGGPIAPVDPGYEDLTSLYPYNPTKAKELLAAAGFGGGLKLTLTIPSFYGNTFPDLLTSQLAQVGITLTVNSVEFSAWLQDVYTNKNYDLSIVDHADSHDFGAWAKPTYYFGYNNPEVQDLYAQSQVAATAEASATLLAKAAKIVSQDAAADWLTNFRTVTAVRDRISGFPTDNINARLDLTHLTAAAS